ncbi:hypothetical protein [Hymenobacter sp. BT730]|uniref:5'-methylthioadenosine/S-adenosylhomocysteine nucleosidase family protein n=1 Tax=Hymenobacter sp. BT730 TaxID=3063332 RepID=UPI0026DEADFF|nr:hypothetical protein [Hymenobacter sp. BT730]
MLTVLILEDNNDKLTAIASTLIRTGLVDSSSIVNVADTLSARIRLRDKQFDLLVLDLLVPEQLGQRANPDGGRHLLEDLLESEEYHMPRRIIGLTGYENLAGELSAEFQAHGVILVHYDHKSDSWEMPLIMQLRQIIATKNAENSTKKSYNIYLGIVCALEVEFDAIQKLPWFFEPYYIDGDSTVYIKGHFSQKGISREVVAALCPRMGMSAASITSIKLIEAFRPEILAMTGITGAVRGQANLGDVIVAEECWDWGMGKWTQLDGNALFVPGPHHLSLESNLHGAALRLKRNSMAMAAIRELSDGPKPETILKMHIGPVASGSAVISTQKMTDHIQAQHRKLIGIEMESYGLYSAAAEATMPRPRAISIKAASDFADDHKDDSFRHFCASASAQVLRHLMETGVD